MEYSEKVQVVFLVDVKPPPDEDLERYCRSLSLACTRILLSMSGFPNKEHLKLQWSYKLFSSERPFKTLGKKVPQFHKLSSQMLELFRRDLTSSVSSECLGKIVTSPRQRQQLQVNLARSIYNVLAGAAQDFGWDAPNIKSPMCSRTRQGKRSLHETVSSTVSKHRNLIFIFARMPLGVFTNNTKGRSPMVDKILPKPLLSQLSCKNICTHWVYEGHGMDQLDLGRLAALSDTLDATGGSMFPISVLLPPSYSGFRTFTSESTTSASQQCCGSDSRKGNTRRTDVMSNLSMPFPCLLKDTLESVGVKEQGREDRNLLRFCSKGEEGNKRPAYLSCVSVSLSYLYL